MFNFPTHSPSSSSSLPSSQQPTSNTPYPTLSNSDYDLWLSLLSDNNLQQQDYQPHHSSLYSHRFAVPHSPPFIPPVQYRPVIPEPKMPDSTTTAGQGSIERRTSRTSFPSSLPRFATNEIDFPTNESKEPGLSLSLPQEKRCAELSPTSPSDTDLCNKNGKRPRTSPPRPPNAFILYRKDMSSEFLQSKTGKFVRNGEISKVIGEMWKNESESVRGQYYLKAAEAKRLHAEKYPEYKFRPVRNLVTGSGGGNDGKHQVVGSVSPSRGNESKDAKLVVMESTSSPRRSVSHELEYGTNPNGPGAHGAHLPNERDRCFRPQPINTAVDPVQRYRPFSEDSGTIGTWFEERRQSTLSDTARTIAPRLVQQPRRSNDFFPTDVDTPEKPYSANAGSRYDSGLLMARACPVVSYHQTHVINLQKCSLSARKRSRGVWWYETTCPANRDGTGSSSYKRMTHPVESPVSWHAPNVTSKPRSSSTLSDTASIIAAQLIQSHPEIQAVLAEAYLAKYLENHRLVPSPHESDEPLSFLPNSPVPKRRDTAQRGPSTMLRTSQSKEPSSTR